MENVFGTFGRLLYSRARASTQAFHLRAAGDFRIQHEVEQFDNVVADLTTIDNGVNHAVFEQKLGLLKILRQLLSYGLFDHAWAGKTDQRFRFRDDNVSQHRKAGGNAARSWISQDRDKG